MQLAASAHSPADAQQRLVSVGELQPSKKHAPLYTHSRRARHTQGLVLAGHGAVVGGQADACGAARCGRSLELLRSEPLCRIVVEWALQQAQHAAHLRAAAPPAARSAALPAMR